MFVASVTRDKLSCIRHVVHLEADIPNGLKVWKEFFFSSFINQVAQPLRMHVSKGVHVAEVGPNCSGTIPLELLVLFQKLNILFN